MLAPLKGSSLVDVVPQNISWNASRWPILITVTKVSTSVTIFFDKARISWASAFPVELNGSVRLTVRLRRLTVKRG
jgi:hypothetical protein